MRKFKKAYSSLLLITILLLSVVFTACGGKKDDQKEETSTVSFSVVYPEDGEDQNQSGQKPEVTEEPSEADVEDPEVEDPDTETEDPAAMEEPAEEPAEYVQYYFRNKKLLASHYEKHGIEMGFANEKEYEKAASDVINNPEALHKTEKEDGDYVFYVEATNEFVILSQDGFIRTYFLPSAGIKYYNRQ